MCSLMISLHWQASMGIIRIDVLLGGCTQQFRQIDNWCNTAITKNNRTYGSLDFWYIAAKFLKLEW